MKPDTADALRAPLVVLAIAVVGFVGYFARDFLIPTAGAIVLALILTPVANALERLRLPVALAAALAVIFSTIAVGGLLALAVPSVQGWAQQAPMLTLKLQGKLEGLRQHIGRIEEVSKEVEKATTPAPPKGATPVEPPPEKVVVRERSLLGELASATPVVVLQVAYAIGLAFFLLSHRHVNRRQVLRIAPTFDARLKLARVMRAVYDRVGHYLFALTLIYFGVAVISAAALAVIGVPNAAIWGALLGLASFIPFAGAPLVVILVAVVAVFTFDDWQRIVAAPAALIVIHVIESQFVTPAVVGKRCAINTVAVFVGIALLGWMWGAIGALVAVPLLILLLTVSEQLPSTRWLATLLSDGTAPSPTIQVVRRRARKKAPAASR